MVDYRWLFQVRNIWFCRKCMKCRNWVAQSKVKDWLREIGVCSSSNRRVLEMDLGVGVASDWWIWLHWPSSTQTNVYQLCIICICICICNVASDWWIWLHWPSTQTNVYQACIICICKVPVSFYQTLSLFHFPQCHIDPSRFHFLILSGWSTFWKLQ